MQQSINTLNRGMASDFHPLSHPSEMYTDALNATLLTNNGNEGILLNDMGNTLIQDSKTGNIMQLREGFVPVGLKEHGGIMYIASVNKDGIGEIGTIPSPVFKYKTLKPFILGRITATNTPAAAPSRLAIETDVPAFEFNAETGKLESDLFQVSDEKLSCGDKFILGLNLGQLTDNISTKDIRKKYKINLYSKTDDEIYPLTDLTKKKYNYITTTGEEGTKGYWFFEPDDEKTDIIDFNKISFNIDQMTASDNSPETNSYLTYPNIPSGYICISLELELINDFSLSKNLTTNIILPITYYNNSDYYICFPTFCVDHGCSNEITKLEITVDDEGGEKQIIHKPARPAEDTKVLTIQIGQIPDSKDYYTLENKEGDDSIKCVVNSYLPGTGSATYKTFNKDVESDTSRDYRSLCLFYINAGTRIAEWYTLTVKYYTEIDGNEIEFGEYRLRFNLYLMDRLNNASDFQLVPETNYTGYIGDGYFRLYYDKNKNKVGGFPETEFDLKTFKIGPTGNPDPNTGTIYLVHKPSVLCDSKTHKFGLSDLMTYDKSLRLLHFDNLAVMYLTEGDTNAVKARDDAWRFSCVGGNTKAYLNARKSKNFFDVNSTYLNNAVDYIKSVFIDSNKFRVPDNSLDTKYLYTAVRSNVEAETSIEPIDENRFYGYKLDPNGNVVQDTSGSDKAVAPDFNTISCVVRDLSPNLSKDSPRLLKATLKIIIKIGNLFASKVLTQSGEALWGNSQYTEESSDRQWQSKNKVDSHLYKFERDLESFMSITKDDIIDSVTDLDIDADNSTFENLLGSSIEFYLYSVSLENGKEYLAEDIKNAWTGGQQDAKFAIDVFPGNGNVMWRSSGKGRQEGPLIPLYQELNFPIKKSWSFEFYDDAFDQDNKEQPEDGRRFFTNTTPDDYRKTQNVGQNINSESAEGISTRFSIEKIVPLNDFTFYWGIPLDSDITNAADYSVCPQLNLMAKDGPTSEATEFGYTVDGENIIPKKCNLDTSKNYLWNTSKGTYIFNCEKITDYKVNTRSSWDDLDMFSKYRVKGNEGSDILYNILEKDSIYYFRIIGEKEGKVLIYTGLIAFDENLGKARSAFGGNAMSIEEFITLLKNIINLEVLTAGMYKCTEAFEIPEEAVLNNNVDSCIILLRVYQYKENNLKCIKQNYNTDSIATKEELKHLLFTYPLAHAYLQLSGLYWIDNNKIKFLDWSINDGEIIEYEGNTSTESLPKFLSEVAVVYPDKTRDVVEYRQILN